MTLLILHRERRLVQDCLQLLCVQETAWRISVEGTTCYSTLEGMNGLQRIHFLKASLFVFVVEVVIGVVGTDIKKRTKNKSHKQTKLDSNGKRCGRQKQIKRRKSIRQ
ncbi:hypothetical protein Tco_0632851 [Tanacetum coccineum]